MPGGSPFSRKSVRASTSPIAMRTSAHHVSILALAVSLFIPAGQASGPARHYFIDPRHLPPPFANKSFLSVPKIVARPPGARLKAPPGFKVDVFASGLHAPRWMVVASNGDVLCVESIRHRIVVLREGPRGVQQTIFADHLYYPFGIAIHGAYLYV